MKKLLSFFLVVILASVVCVPALADTVSPEFTVATVQGAPGDTVKLLVSATNAEDIATFMLNITYDSTKLSVTNVTTTGVLSGNGRLLSNKSTANGKLSLVWEKGTALTSSGKLFNVEFKISSGLSSCKLDVDISSTGGYVRDSRGLDMNSTFVAGAINVVSATPEITFSMEDVSAKNGEKVTVSVLIAKNPGISEFMLNLEYDDELLTPVEVAAGTILAGTAAPRSNISQADGKLVLSWEDDANLTPIGEILRITFSVSEAITSQTTTLKLSEDSSSYFRNSDNKDIKPFFDDAEMTIESDYSKFKLFFNPENLTAFSEYFASFSEIFAKMSEMFVKVVETIMTVLLAK